MYRTITLTALAGLGLIFASGVTASASILNIGQYVGQIQEIERIMAAAKQPLGVGDVMGQFGGMYPGNSGGMLTKIGQEAAQQLAASEASMGTGAGEVGNQIDNMAYSGILDAAATGAAGAGTFIPNPNPSLYVLNETMLQIMNQEAQANAAAGQAAEVQAQYYAGLAQHRLDAEAADTHTNNIDAGSNGPTQGI